LYLVVVGFFKVIFLV